MKIIRVTYFALLVLFSIASCSKEAAEGDVFDRMEESIYFKTPLSDLSRANNMTLDNLESFQVTCFADGSKADEDGFITPHFENATFIRRTGSSAFATFVSSPGEEPRQWPDTKGIISFFAFSPSLDVMAAGNSAINDADRNRYFNLINRSVNINSTVATDYRLANFRVNPDISRQVDFITACTSGVRLIDFMGGVELAFRHQMSQIELKAWGSSPTYNLEIAGVRLGNPVVEDTFVFSDAASPASFAGWAKAGEPVKDKVEYLYREATDIPGSGDKVFHISGYEHNNPEAAASVMGRGGCAMVLPTVNPRWEGLTDPNIGTMPYTTGKMYFSILLRATNPTDGKPIYPYPGNPYGMTVVYYAVDRSDAIVTRLYPGPTADTFFTDPELQHPYVAAEGETVKDFGWAAVPVDADWSAGQKYVYTIDYSEGIGLHDPQDPDPGKPIAMISEPVSWGVTVETWEDADDFDPDINVPGYSR